MATKNKGEQNIEDVAFILSEVERFGAMTPDEVKSHLASDPYGMFMHLRHPTRGILFCGQFAFTRFHELARRTMTPGSLAEKFFYLSDYVSALREGFVELFIDQRKTVNEGSVQKLINRATEICTKNLVESTHHVPCALFFEKEPPRFSLGPITFTWCEHFLEEIEDGLTDYRQRSFDLYVKGEQQQAPGTPPAEIIRRATDFADRELSNLRQYYSKYRWIASVPIPKCHETLSLSRAERTIDAALDVLRLFTVSNPGRYRRANAANIPLDRHELVTNRDGKIAVTRWLERQGAQAGENWYTEIFNHPVTKKVWELFAEAIEPLPEGRFSDHLNERILDALSWFGQALVESNPGAKVVKFTAALERLTMTGHVENDIEELVIKRVMTLNQDREDTPREKITKDLGELYECRSNLMHGSISPYHRSIEKVLPNALYATRWALFNAIQLFAHLRAAGETNRQALGQAYDGGRVERRLATQR